MEKPKTLVELLSDPVTFYHDLTGHAPHDYQVWLLNQSLMDGARIVLLIARRGGKTEGLGIKIVYEGITTTEKDFRVLVYAPCGRQASFLYRVIRRALSHPALIALRRAWEKMHGRKLLDSANELEIPNNHGRGLTTVCVLSGDQRGEAKYQVGDRADIFICDEACNITDSTYYKLREVRRTGKYRAEVLLSTPKQESGFFYEAARPPDNRWDETYNSHYVSAQEYQVLHRDLEHIPHVHDAPKIWAEVQRDMATMDDLDIETEFYAHFVSGHGKFFSADDIKRCSQTVGHWSNYAREKPLICCIDLAIEEDEAVATWLSCDGHYHLTVIHTESFKRHPDKGTETRAIQSKGAIVRLVAKLRNGGLRPTKVYVDATNDDSFPDLLSEAGFKVEPVHWSPKQKTELMFGLKDALQAGKITLPAASEGYHARQLHTQLLNYSYDITEFGNYQWNVRQDTKRRRKKWSDDYVSSLAMSTKWLIEMNTIRPISRVGGKRSQWDSLTISNRERAAMTA